MSTYCRRFVSLSAGLFIVILVSPCLINSSASAGWQIQTVDSAGVVGEYTSLAFDASGNPAISYYDNTNGNIKFAHDKNGDGDFADPGEIITVDSTGDVGWFTSLAFDASGNPAISYYDSTNGNLKFAHDKNGDGDFLDPGEIITVDSAGNVGWFTSLAFDASGNPAISYYDLSNFDLKFAYDKNGDGDFLDPGEIITVDSTGVVGWFTSLAFDASGNPAISYYGSTNNDDLKFAHDKNGDGDFADPGEIITVDSAGDVGPFSSLAFHPTSGTPAISYSDETNFDHDLKFAHDKNGDGDFADPGEIITVDPARGADITSLAFDASGNPAISYFVFTNFDLKFARFVPGVCDCPADSPKGCISGQVTDKDTGAHLEGKTVKLKRTSPRRPRVKMEVVTDSDGCYSFTDLEDGTYKVKVVGCRGGGTKTRVVTGGGKVNRVNFECK